MNLLASGPVTITLPQIHWASTSAEIIICLIVLVLMWLYGKNWDHRIMLILAVLIGIALTLTNAGAWTLAHVHVWTHGLLG